VVSLAGSIESTTDAVEATCACARRRFTPATAAGPVGTKVTAADPDIGTGGTLAAAAAAALAAAPHSFPPPPALPIARSSISLSLPPSCSGTGGGSGGGSAGTGTGNDTSGAPPRGASAAHRRSSPNAAAALAAQSGVAPGGRPAALEDEANDDDMSGCERALVSHWRSRPRRPKTHGHAS